MKKIYNLLALAFFLIAGATVSQAQDYYVADPSSGENVSEFEEGVTYAIKSARYAESYLCNDGISNAINAECLYQFEKVGQSADGDQTWRIRRVSDGKWIMASEYVLDGQPAVSYTNLEDFAGKWCIGKPRVYASIPEAGDENYEEWIQDKYITISGGGENSWVVFEADVEGYNFLALWTGDGAAHIWNYVDTNALRFVQVQPAQNAQKVSLAMADLCPSGLGGYSAGNNIGQCDQAALDEALAAYAVCEELVNTNSKDSEACDAAVARLKAAIDALTASVKTLEPGYYYIVSAGRTSGGNAAVPYDDGTSSTVLWNYYSSDIPEQATVESAPYIWKFTQEGDLWYIQSYQTGKYMGEQSGLSTALPLTDTPVGYNIKSITDLMDGNGEPQIGYFNIQHPSNPNWCMHAQASGTCMVYWEPASGTNNTASAWTFVGVEESELEALREQIEQKDLENKVANLLEDASIAYNSTKSYISDATADDNFTDEPGFLMFEQSDPADASTANVTSNAKEPAEGSIEALFDGDFTTYFHTMWSTSPQPNGPHYLQIDLGAEYKQLVMKYARRHNNSNGSPTIVTIMSSDDAENWTEELTFKITYSFPVTITEDNVMENWGGLAGFEMAAPHRYIRIVVKETAANGLTAGYPFWYWSELRVYEGQGFDEDNSLLTVIDQNAVQGLLDAIADTKAAQASNSVTQATLDALQAAYDKFLEYYPEPAKITTLLNEAKALVAGATEGTGVGLYAEGSKAALQAAIDEVTPKVQDIMTLDEVNACVATMRAAIDAFNAGLQMPDESKMYFIESHSTSNANNTGHRLFANNNDLTVIRHGGFVADGDNVTYDSDIDSRLNFMWTIHRNEDGTYAIRNVGTGYYISSNYTANNASILQSVEPAAITLRAAPEDPGSFNLVMGEGLYANAQPASALEANANLVTWNSASGPDNSSFVFNEVSAMPFASYIDVAQGAKVMTLPYEILSDQATPIYTVAGINENNEIQFVPFASDVVPAGTPFLYVNEDETITTDIFILNGANSHEDIVYAAQPQTVNGMVGTLPSVTIEEPGIGVLMGGRVIVTESKTVIAANSGYFTGALPQTTVEGDYSLPLAGTLTGIGNLDVVNNKARMDVYTISGVKVRSNVSGSEATRNLPAGIYIVGGKKVLVK